MFCKHCGTQLGENDRFCPGCGAPMADQAPAGPSYIAPAPGNPLLAASRSPLFLIAVICASVVALFQVVNLVFTFNTLSEYIDRVIWMEGGREAAAGVNMVQTLSVVFSLGALLIAVLILIGLWMTYAAGAQDKALGLVRGLKLVRGSVLAQMIYTIVMLCLLAFALLMLALVGGVMGSAMGGYDYYYYDSDYYAAKAAANMMTMVAVVGLVIILAVGVLMVVFYLKAHKALGYAIATAQTGVVAGAPSMYLIVMCFIMGALSVFYTVVGLTLPGPAVMAMLTSLAGAAQSILFGAVALSWRNKVLAAA